MSYYLDHQFENVCLMSYKRHAQMRRYIDSLYENFLEPNGLGDIITDLPTAIFTNKTKLMNRLDKLNKILNLVLKKELSEPGSFYFYGRSVNSFKAWLSIFDQYIKFLKKQPGAKIKKATFYWEKEWDKTLDLLAHYIDVIDGTTSLINILGNRKHFIEVALKNSIFMDPKNVSPRFSDIYKEFISKTPKLYSRKSDDKGIQVFRKGVWFFNYEDLSSITQSIPIIRDKDGNTEVRKLIRTSTGFTVSSGAKSKIINYKISHIWQNAFDPRYFTNYWNLVLVPSWASDLLDKSKFSNYFILQLINTYKAVCTKFYGMNSLNWASIQMNPPSYKARFVCHGTYDILYFNGTSIATTTVVVP